ncbi:MAG TPA: S41 family peptidase, partial [Candidatus Limnocylindrales bacterium]|nr:S41 family peptidase [Candidatus Limnocylindrales bacterium]
MSTSPTSESAASPEPELPTPPAPAPRRPRRRAGWIALAIVFVLGGSTLFASGYALGRLQSATPGTPADEQALFQPFWDAYTAIVDQYAAGPVDKKKLVEGAIGGLFGALGDPFSLYLTPDQFTSSLSGISGQFEGIGATLTTQDGSGAQGCTPISATCRLTIVSVISGAPAQKAGLEAADVVTAVDGTSLDGQTVDQAVALIRGPRGTVVTLTVVRDNGAPFPLPITRDVVQQSAVESSVIADGQVGYIKLNGFNAAAAQDFHDRLKGLVDKGLTRIIFDLRGDPGGFVDQAQDIASQFIGSGPVFIEEYADGRQVPQLAKPGGVATDPKIQLLVLIDKNSASASEIVAGAIQARGRGKLVGATSYGKGTIQEFLQLSNDMGGFRLSIAKWLTPNGVWINGKGLTPDVPVTVPDGTPA